MEHGGDIWTYGNGDALLDFSSNINPLPLPEACSAAIAGAMRNAQRYPDIHYRTAKQSVATYLGCMPEQVVLGSGAMELIDRFLQDASRVVLCFPGFSEYEQRARIHGKELCLLPLAEDFSLPVDRILETLREGDRLLLGNPNNPTGKRIPKEQVLLLAERCKEKKAVLILDEAFCEFCAPDYDSVALFANDESMPVYILRAATKFFAMPGIRLAYACLPGEAARNAQRKLLPWNVNCFAERAARCIFAERDYITKSRSDLIAERKRMLSRFHKLVDFYAYDSDCNFILIRSERRTERELLERFLEHGILIRTCSSFRGLDAHHVRVAVRSEQENDRLLRVFEQLDARSYGVSADTS